MELALIVYLAGIVGTLREILFVGTTIGFILYASYFLIALIECYEIRKKWIVFCCVVSLIIAAFIPSERTIYLMTGAYLGQQVIQSSTASKVKQVIEMKLDEIIVETSSKSKK